METNTNQASEDKRQERFEKELQIWQQCHKAILDMNRKLLQYDKEHWPIKISFQTKK